jgi:hypothetical protein
MQIYFIITYRIKTVFKFFVNFFILLKFLFNIDKLLSIKCSLIVLLYPNFFVQHKREYFHL